MKSLRGFATLLVLALAPGCAAHKQNQMHERAGKHVYTRPLPEVWAHVQPLLEARGFAVRSSEGYELVTEWREDIVTTQGKTSFTRYLVRGTALSPTSCTVHLYRVSYITQDAGAGQGRNVERGTWQEDGRGTMRSDENGRITGGEVDESAAKPKLGGNGMETMPQVDRFDTGDRSSFALATEKGYTSRDLELEYALLELTEPEAAQAYVGP